MPKTRQTTGKPATRKVGKPFTVSKDRAARKAKPATVSADQAEREANAILADAASDASPHRVLTTVSRRGRQAKPATAAADPNPIAIDPFAEAAALEAETANRRIADVAKPAETTPALPETRPGAPQALVIDVGA